MPAGIGPPRPPTTFPAVVDRKCRYLTPEQEREYKRLKRELNKLRLLPKWAATWLCRSTGVSRARRKRSSWFAPAQSGIKVEPGFPQVLGFADPKNPRRPRVKPASKVLADWVPRRKPVDLARVRQSALAAPFRPPESSPRPTTL